MGRTVLPPSTSSDLTQEAAASTRAAIIDSLTATDAPPFAIRREHLAAARSTTADDLRNHGAWTPLADITGGQPEAAHARDFLAKLNDDLNGGGS